MTVEALANVERPEGFRRVSQVLAERGHPHRPRWLEVSARTCAEAAEALGVQVGQIAKSVVFRRRSDGVAVLVVASGDRRVDEGKVASVVGAIGRADAAFVKQQTGFSIGGVSPVAHAQPPVVLVDRADQRGADAPVSLGATGVDAEALRSRPVVVRGRFDTTHQILLDNRIHREQAGYHVITPLRIEGSDMRVLVNRGWVPASALHSDLPQIATPTGPVALHGTAVVPGTRFFTLGKEPIGEGWQPVWQNLDLARFTRLVPWPLQPVVLQLAPDAPAGFAREWPRPDERFERHLSYAWQWYGFAASALLIWLALGWKRP